MKVYVILDDKFIVAEISYNFSPFIQGNDESLIEVAFGNILNASIGRVKLMPYKDEKWVDYPYKGL